MSEYRAYQDRLHVAAQAAVAACHGAPLIDNPYPDDPILTDAWKKGWAVGAFARDEEWKTFEAEVGASATNGTTTA